MPQQKKDCPVLGCNALQLTRLAHHLEYMHGLKGEAKKTYLKQTKKVRTPAPAAPTTRPNTSQDTKACVKESVVQGAELDTQRNENLDDKQKMSAMSKTEALIPLLPHCSISIIGSTGCGKTRFTKKLIDHKDSMFLTNPPKKILYCYGAWQPLFDEIEQTVDNVLFHEGLPTFEYIKEYADSQHLLIIFDDLMNECVRSPMMEKIFVMGCHHEGLSTIYITQNLYQQGPCARTIGLNSTYMSLFRNIRDQNQIRTFGSQMGKTKVFMEAFVDATSKKYGYLFL